MGGGGGEREAYANMRAPWFLIHAWTVVVLCAPSFSFWSRRSPGARSSCVGKEAVLGHCLTRRCACSPCSPRLLRSPPPPPGLFGQFDVDGSAPDVPARRGSCQFRVRLGRAWFENPRAHPDASDKDSGLSGSVPTAEHSANCFLQPRGH